MVKDRHEMAPLEALATQLATLDANHLPDEVVEAARQRLFDTLACFVAGDASPEGNALRGVLNVAPAGLPETIRYACAATRCTEVDDIHPGSCTTVGSMIVPAVMLTAATCRAGDGDVLCSLVAGYEAMTRLGTAVDGARRIYEGVWSTYLTAPFAVAAAVARLLNFDREKTGHALAIAAVRSSGIAGRAPAPFGARWFTIGCGAADGWWAAQAAGSGLLGDLGVLEGGFGKATGVAVDTEPLAADGWRILEIDAKPFRTSRQALSATEAFIRASAGRSMSEIASVRVWVPGQVRAMVDNPGFGLGVQRQIALAACDRAALWDVAQRRINNQTAAESFLARVSVDVDARLTELYPSQWAGRAEVTFADGSSAVEEVLDPSGSWRSRYSWANLLDKHEAIAEASGLPTSWLTAAHRLCRTFGLDGAATTARELLALLPVDLPPGLS